MPRQRQNCRFFKNISLVSSPSVSRVLIRMRCAASSRGAMRKLPSLVGMEEERKERRADADERTFGRGG